MVASCRLLASWFLVSSTLHTTWGATKKKDGKAKKTVNMYEEMCDTMWNAGGRAIQYHNAGDETQAMEQVEVADDAFHGAIKLDDDNYEAYCNYATLNFNIHRLDLASEHFAKCLDRMRHLADDDTLKKQMQHFVVEVEYAKASRARDAVYQDGQGDLEETLRLMNKQLEIYPRHPANLHAKGILLVSMAATNSTAQDAVKSLKAAQAAATAAYPHCPKKRKAKVVRNWRKGAHVTIREIDGQDAADRKAYIAEFDDVTIYGDDGVIIPNSACEMYIPGGEFTNLADNIPLNEVWTSQTPSPEYNILKYVNRQKDQRPTSVRLQKIAQAGIVIGFASTDFYHTLIEVGSRLLLLSEFLRNETMPIIVPRCKTLVSLMKLLNIKNPVIPASRALTTEPRFQVGKLWYAHWPSCNIEMDGCHCTPPAHILQKLQAALVPNIAMPTPHRMLYVPRDREMGVRFLENEDEVLKEYPGLETFKPGEASLEEAIITFQSASTVIAVHGGALSNTLFCKPGTKIVEFGWPQVPILGHFRHLSKALNLDHHTVPLNLDQRGVSAAKVSVNMTHFSHASAKDEL